MSAADDAYVVPERLRRRACPGGLTDEDSAVWKPVVAIAIGSILGGLLRWVLGLRFNAVLSSLPLGTLMANLVAGYVIGVAIAFFAQAPQLSPEWRLLVITGFCGGLSTFSTFSAEIVNFMQRGQLGWAMGAIAIHVGGSVLMTFAGLATVTLFKS